MQIVFVLLLIGLGVLRQVAPRFLTTDCQEAKKKDILGIRMIAQQLKGLLNLVKVFYPYILRTAVQS